MYLFYCPEKALVEVQDHIRTIYPILNSIFDHGERVLKAKGLLLILLLVLEDFNILTSIPLGKFMTKIDKLSSEKSKHIKSILKEYVNIFKFNIQEFLEVVDKELPLILKVGYDTSDALLEGDSPNSLESVDSSLIFIADTLQSLYLQTKILDEESIVKIYQMVGFVAEAAGKENKVVRDIASNVLTIIETLNSNINLLTNNSEAIVRKVIPSICNIFKT